MTDRQTPKPKAAPARVPAKAAATMLGISVRTLDRYQAAGRIQPTPTPLVPRMFRVADIARLRGEA